MPVVGEKIVSPGPWRWLTEREMFDRDHDHESVAVLVDANGDEVCNFGRSTQFYPSEGNPPGEADSKVLAAAPAMVALLRECWLSLRSVDRGENQNVSTERKIELLLASVGSGPPGE